MESLIIKRVIEPHDWREFSQFKEQIELPLARSQKDPWNEVNNLRLLAERDALRKCAGFLALRGEKIVGRIMAIHDDRHASQQEGFFGFFECLRDLEGAQGLIQAAGQELRSWGKTLMLGPISPSTNEKVGIMVDGFATAPHPFVAYNPPYYQELLENSGLRKVMGLLSYLWRNDLPIPNRFRLIAARGAEKYQIAIHYPARGRIHREAPILREVYNESLGGNWGFVPLTLEEARNVISEYRGSPNPEFLFRLDINDQPAGICFLQSNPLPQLSEGNGSLPVRVAVLGLRPEFRKKGLSTQLIFQAIELLERNGYLQAEVSLIMENNHTVRSLIERNLQCPVLYRHQVYGLKLAE